MTVLLLQKILHKLNGLYYPQEYLCFSLEKFRKPLHVYLCNDKEVIHDVSEEHLFIGYKPLIIALPFVNNNNIRLVFSRSIIFEKAKINNNEILASLFLKQIQQVGTRDGNICYYECIHGSHRFVNTFHQWISALNNKLFSNKAGNIYLEGNLLKQVQIAYAVPRKICLITTGEDRKYNLFPTDLHGRMGEHYIISLRTDGKACDQVVSTGKIVLSDIDAAYYKEVYALGKNHMKEQQSEEHFAFNGKYSENYHLPLPAYATSYKELELVSSVSHGIHKLLLFRIVNAKNLSDTGNTLVHIHNVYATWRHRNNIETEYYFR